MSLYLRIETWIKMYLIAGLLISTSVLNAQPSISGRVNFEADGKWAPKIYLVKLDVDHLEDLKYAKEIAWSSITSEGVFTFDRKHISEKDAIYRLYVKRVEQAIRDTMATSGSFILSKTDTMQFYSGERLFSEYSTTNQADKEWKKLQAFESDLLRSKILQIEGDSQLKSYTKDSLRILMVKLIGVKQLEEKQLLDQDIAKNPQFYLTLLTELRESEMPVEHYRFLQKRLAFLTQAEIEEKYAWSKVVNFLLGFVVLSLGTILFFRRRKEEVLPDLSRQERTIQKLILQGKTNKEIANELFISISTVKTHITNIYSKLNVSSRRDLVRRFQN